MRALISKLNKQRKIQAQKTDILCNDIIATQKQFIKRLNAFSFAADFYESIIGTTDLNELVLTAGELIKDELANANVVFFLRQESSFQMHLFESDGPVAMEQPRLENYFTNEFVSELCKSNSKCTIESLAAMGLAVGPAVMSKISAVTIPLAQSGKSLGFILIYCPSQNKLTNNQINHISAITPGLSHAIASARIALHQPD